ncbi:hypothetical protein PFDG_05173 [Plasmodium falciparum Dd2]|uniref:Uncharacterized protein n=1 Tax=Plasmodium falciparum (isolate Dd2) TaxID=57267 RepID=A0A0L7M9T6_PLAF4|nr:hypothetical protein PFDG_05173 [Plasmodium falciparum Dd2]
MIQFLEHHQTLILSLNQLKASFFLYERKNIKHSNMCKLEYKDEIYGDKQKENDNPVSSTTASLINNATRNKKNSVQ